VSGIVNHVSLSPSGLLIEITVTDDGREIGSVQINESSWPAIVANVQACLTERRVLAEVETIVTGAADECFED
jgi:hypothetical protein